MNYELPTTNSKGFSLTEVLLAVGILAVGMLFIAGTFLVGVHFSTIATEQTIAAVASDEAFAKIKIYGVNPAGLPVGSLVPFNLADPNEFAYPSTNSVAEKQYYWSALCGRTQDGLVQVTVFVSRKTAPNTRFRNPADPFNLIASLFYPVPVNVGVSSVAGAGNENKLLINMSRPPPAEETFIHSGYTIVDNEFGRIYRVVDWDATQPNRIILDRPWLGGATGFVWVVPPPFGGGRHPCIAVYQTNF
jgi:prepilin-type N-terminal cleavage/methylation domain-containing protein